MSTILIVEDEPKLAALMADYLKASGFAAHCIADASRWCRGCASIRPTSCCST